jgi:transposase InsO family protein
MIIKSELNIKFEFAAPGTPQQNGKMERAFETLFGKTRPMLKAARITIPLRKGL